MWFNLLKPACMNQTRVPHFSGLLGGEKFSEIAIWCSMSGSNSYYLYSDARRNVIIGKYKVYTTFLDFEIFIA